MDCSEPLVGGADELPVAAVPRADPLRDAEVPAAAAWRPSARRAVVKSRRPARTRPGRSPSRAVRHRVREQCLRSGTPRAASPPKTWSRTPTMYVARGVDGEVADRPARPKEQFSSECVDGDPRPALAARAAGPPADALDAADAVAAAVDVGAVASRDRRRGGPRAVARHRPARPAPPVERSRPGPPMSLSLPPRPRCTSSPPRPQIVGPGRARSRSAALGAADRAAVGRRGWPAGGDGGDRARRGRARGPVGVGVGDGGGVSRSNTPGEASVPPGGSGGPPVWANATPGSATAAAATMTVTAVVRNIGADLLASVAGTLRSLRPRPPRAQTTRVWSRLTPTGAAAAREALARTEHDAPVGRPTATTASRPDVTRTVAPSPHRSSTSQLTAPRLGRACTVSASRRTVTGNAIRP